MDKTTLAVFWAHQIAENFPDGQLYVSLRGFDPSGVPVAPEDALRGFLEALGVDPKRMPSTLDALSAKYRSALAGRKVLILLDNARDAAHVRPLLPGSSHCLAIVTSRATMAGLVAAEGAYPLTLDLLDAPAARDLLTRRLGAEQMRAEAEACGQLIELCAGLPLALSVAAARAVTHPRLPIGALVTQLRSARSRLPGMAQSAFARSSRGRTAALAQRPRACSACCVCQWNPTSDWPRRQVSRACPFPRQVLSLMRSFPRT